METKSDKIKITQQEIDDIYEIEGITEGNSKATAKPTQEDTTPEFLTEEEQAFDIAMHQDEKIEEELE